MSKNKQKFKNFQQGQGVPSKLKGISLRGWKVIGLGVGIAALGYFVLTFTDPAGQNWASNLCPFLILGGYATVGVGILLPETSSADIQQASQPK